MDNTLVLLPEIEEWYKAKHDISSDDELSEAIRWYNKNHAKSYSAVMSYVPNSRPPLIFGSLIFVIGLIVFLITRNPITVIFFGAPALLSWILASCLALAFVAAKEDFNTQNRTIELRIIAERERNSKHSFLNENGAIDNYKKFEIEEQYYEEKFNSLTTQTFAQFNKTKQTIDKLYEHHDLFTDKSLFEKIIKPLEAQMQSLTRLSQRIDAKQREVRNIFKATHQRYSQIAALKDVLKASELIQENEDYLKDTYAHLDEQVERLMLDRSLNFNTIEVFQREIELNTKSLPDVKDLVGSVS